MDYAPDSIAIPGEKKRPIVALLGKKHVPADILLVSNLTQPLFETNRPPQVGLALLEADVFRRRGE